MWSEKKGRKSIIFSFVMLHHAFHASVCVRVCSPSIGKACFKIFSRLLKVSYVASKSLSESYANTAGGGNQLSNIKGLHKCDNLGLAEYRAMSRKGLKA